jgi:DNA-directed RNA polymerase subunit RPC12/RpoP
MITCQCEQCGGEFPMNETLKVEERILCETCCEKVLAQEHPPVKNLQRQSDPTVCANCRKDNGTAALPLLAGLPVCGTCEAFFRHRPFPPWIKLALAAVLALVVVSLVWNARFYRAYFGLQRLLAGNRPVAPGQECGGAGETDGVQRPAARDV